MKVPNALFPFNRLSTLWWILVYPITLLVCFFLTFSKGGAAALVLAALAYLIWHFFISGKKEERIVSSKNTFIKASFALMAFVSVGFLIWHYKDFLVHRLQMPTLQNRWDYWQAAVRMWFDFPLLGSGLGTFAILYPSYKNLGAQDAQHTHNDYLQVLVESGLFAFLLLASILFIILFKALFLAPKNQAQPLLFMAIVWGLVALAIHHACDFDFYIPGLGGCEWIFLGLISARVLATSKIQLSLNSFSVEIAFWIHF